MPDKIIPYKPERAKHLADFIFFLHLTVVFIILFGWTFPKLSAIYLLALIATLASELILGYCILTKWEFDLRKKLDPNLSYDYSFLSYYGYKLIGDKISAKIIRPAALIFLSGSIIIYLWNHWLTK